MNTKYLFPALAALALTASVAVAQMPPAGGRAPARTPPTAEQIAARRTAICTDMAARGAARIAYLETKLNLTSAQKPLFERWKASVQGEQAARQADCAKPRPARDANAPRPTLAERNQRMEDGLKNRLATLEKTRPAQEALDNALTADQKRIFESAGRGRMAMGRGHERPGMRRFAGGHFGGPGFGRPGFGPGRPGFGPGGPGRPGQGGSQGPGPQGPG
jgi:hypothetical protein